MEEEAGLRRGMTVWDRVGAAAGFVRLEFGWGEVRSFLCGVRAVLCACEGLNRRLVVRGSAAEQGIVMPAITVYHHN